MQLYIHLLKFPLKFYFRLNSKLRLLVGLLNCEGSLILTHSGSGLVPRKTVIGINIATSASRSIGNLRWLLDRESVAAICGQASFIVKVERIWIYIHQEIAPGAGAWLQSLTAKLSLCGPYLFNLKFEVDSVLRDSGGSLS